VPSFNAAGGDGYPVIDPVMTGYVDAEVLYSFFKQQGNIVASEFTPSNQVVYTNSDSVNGCLINE
ncbi:MAG: bifunctional UDP-sugar hydrolase/5'-nucleotidase, partial [Moritella sp.]|nr:bifunctional UDP-sugar hydrolase/5'-nucleotidase [Moritella sp.]